jgi:biopolymer transport protein ExbD
MPAKETEKLSAAQRSKVRRLSEPKELAPDEEGGELNIVPFLDIVTNVLMFVLATISVTFTTMIDSQPPRFSGSSARPPTTPTLSLNVIVLKDGFLVSAVGQRIGQGCQGPGAGLAVGTKTVDGKTDYDYASLTACAKRLKELSPDFADERQATIAANHDIPYQSIISTLDALRRSDDGKELFPEVNFGVPK